MKRHSNYSNGTLFLTLKFNRNNKSTSLKAVIQRSFRIIHRYSISCCTLRNLHIFLSFCLSEVLRIFISGLDKKYPTER